MDFPEQIRKTNLLENEELNHPDLKFYHKCYQDYHINRGIFNTIDDWFFEYGVIDIVYRRFYILAFLEFVKGNLSGTELINILNSDMGDWS